jgi:hypothetical protein
MQKIEAKDYAQLQKANRKLKRIGPGYGIRNLYRTPRGGIASN